MKGITGSNYTRDHYHPKVTKTVGELLGEKGYVAPVDLFVKLGFLSAEGLAEWRAGDVRCLEQALRCDVVKAARILELLRRHAHDLRLKPSTTIYLEQRKGRRYLLRFSKKEDPAVEKAFSRHFVPLAAG